MPHSECRNGQLSYTQLGSQFSEQQHSSSRNGTPAKSTPAKSGGPASSTSGNSASELCLLYKSPLSESNCIIKCSSCNVSAHLYCLTGVFKTKGREGLKTSWNSSLNLSKRSTSATAAQSALLMMLIIYQKWLHPHHQIQRHLALVLKS